MPIHQLQGLPRDYQALASCHVQTLIDAFVLQHSGIRDEGWKEYREKQPGRSTHGQATKARGILAELAAVKLHHQ